MVLIRDGSGIRDTKMKNKKDKSKMTKKKDLDKKNEEEIEEDELSGDDKGEEKDDDGTGEGGENIEEEDKDTTQDTSDDVSDEGDVDKGDNEEEYMSKDISDNDNAEKVEVEKGDKDEDSRGKSIQMHQETSDDDSSDDEEDSRPLQTQNMYFDPSQYTKSVRIGTRCNVQQTVEFLEQFPAELKWLRENEQFKHVFHMPMERNHQVQGMWMLMLRTTCIEAEKECWFLVNGRLIRYSIREHALLTGFNCKEYPPNWEKLGGLEFAKRMFKKTKGIKIGAVENMLESMKNKKTSGDRMKLAVLYFLCKVLKAKNKYEPTVDTFLLKIVNDLSVCSKFPWGRYTFNDCIDGIKGLVKNMKGVVKTNAQPGFSGFIIPPEILAFECIRDLGHKFREDVRADPGCPRMCKRKFVHGDNKGPSLDDINAALGNTKEITSILQPTLDEQELLSRNVEDVDDDGFGFIDPIIGSWRDRLLVQKKKIFWKSWFEKDVEARAPNVMMIEAEGVDEKDNPVEQRTLESLETVVLKEMEKGFGILMGVFGEMSNKVFDRLSVLETKMHILHNFVAAQRMDVRSETGTPNTGFILINSPPCDIPIEFMAPIQEMNDKENKEENEGDKENEKENEEEHDGDENEEHDADENEKDNEEAEDGVIETRAKRNKRPPNRYTPGDQKKQKK